MTIPVGGMSIPSRKASAAISDGDVDASPLEKLLTVTPLWLGDFCPLSILMEKFDAPFSIIVNRMAPPKRSAKCLSTTAGAPASPKAPAAGLSSFTLVPAGVIASVHSAKTRAWPLTSAEVCSPNMAVPLSNSTVLPFAL